MSLNTKYRLERKLTSQKSGKFHYSVILIETGEVVSTRRSNREYVAATADGQYYFGRLDLIGRGDHGKNVRWAAEKGITLEPIAYLETGPVEIQEPDPGMKNANWDAGDYSK